MTIIRFAKKNFHYVVMAIIVLLAVFYLRNDIKSVSFDFLMNQKPTLRTSLRCPTQAFDQSILQSRRNDHDTIRLLIHFNEKPSSDVRDFLQINGVSIYPDTWVFDYLVAETSVDRLCFLASLPGITAISLGESA